MLLVSVFALVYSEMFAYSYAASRRLLRYAGQYVICSGLRSSKCQKCVNKNGNTG